MTRLKKVWKLTLRNGAVLWTVWSWEIPTPGSKYRHGQFGHSDETENRGAGPCLNINTVFQHVPVTGILIIKIDGRDYTSPKEVEMGILISLCPSIFKLILVIQSLWICCSRMMGTSVKWWMQLIFVWTQYINTSTWHTCTCVRPSHLQLCT